MHFSACTSAISKQKSPLSSGKKQGETFRKKMGTFEKNSHSRMSHRQRGQTEDTAAVQWVGRPRRQIGTAFTERPAWLNSHRPNRWRHSVRASNCERPVFLFYQCLFSSFFKGCDALQVCKQLPMWWHPRPRGTGSYHKVPKKQGEKRVRGWAEWTAQWHTLSEY